MARTFDPTKGSVMVQVWISDFTLVPDPRVPKNSVLQGQGRAGATCHHDDHRPECAAANTTGHWPQSVGKGVVRLDLRDLRSAGEYK